MRRRLLGERYSNTCRAWPLACSGKLLSAAVSDATSAAAKMDSGKRQPPTIALPTVNVEDDGELVTVLLK